MNKDIKGLIYGYLTLEEKMKIREIDDPVLDKQIIKEMWHKMSRTDIEMKIKKYDYDDDHDDFYIVLKIRKNRLKTKIVIDEPQTIPISVWEACEVSIRAGYQRYNALNYGGCKINCDDEKITFTTEWRPGMGEEGRITVSINREENKEKICGMIKRIVENLRE